MNHSKSRKLKTRKGTGAPEEGQDFISNLPEDIKRSILSYLSTRAAVQTSVLSSEWRNTWTSIPEVSIREADFVSPCGNVQKTRTRLVKFVDAFLDHHNSPISKFELESDREKDYHNAFERWFLHLSSCNELRELSFKSCSIHMYQLPTSFFSCHGLSILRLHDCAIEPPRGFQGFKSICVLELQRCFISDDDLEKIVSSSSILVELVIELGRSWFYDIIGNPSLKIHAPKLKNLIIHGGFASILLKTPCLVKAYFELCEVPAGHCNLVEALGSLSEIEVLGFHQHFLAYLLAGSLPNLPLPFRKLRVWALDANLASAEEVSLIRFLLQNSPNLLELHLTNRTRNRLLNSAGLCQGGLISQTNSTIDGPLNYAGSWQNGPCVFFMSLRVVELYEFFISESEIAFLKFILASAPLLEQLKVVTEKYIDAKKKDAVVEILQGIPKYSINLQITIE